MANPLLERYRAWRRGEKRIAPRGVRGRVYRKKGEPDTRGGLQSTASPVVTVTARVYRAATNTWEKLDG